MFEKSLLMKPKLFLLAIILLGLVLRTYRLDQFPSGFNPDEASFGYDAYSLLTTGKDHWGQSWPLAFRSFGDFKLPVYTYLTLPSLALLGLNEFAVRLPSALIGTLALLSTYLFTIEIFKKSHLSSFDRQMLGLTASFLLAISPWHISLSRGAFESNLTSFFLPLGLYFLLKTKHSNSPPYNLKLTTYNLTSGLILGLNLYTYHAARYFTPLLLLTFILWFTFTQSTSTKPKLLLLKDNLKKFSPVLLIFSLFLIPIMLSFFDQTASRISDVGIFNPTDNWQAVSERQWQAVQQNFPTLPTRIFNNKAFYLVEHFTDNYLSYFSPRFLFTQGPGEAWYGLIPGRGLLNWIEPPLLIIALIYFIKKPSPAPLFILSWILLAPLPAALSKGPFAAHRSAILLPTLPILSAYGLTVLLNYLPKIKWTSLKPPHVATSILNSQSLFGTLFFLSAFCSLLFFLEDYFLHAPLTHAPVMSYGWRQIYQQIAPVENQYSQIIVSRRFSEPQIFTAFYLRLDPHTVQAASTDWLRYQNQHLPFLDQLGEYHLDKFTYRDLNYPADRQLPRTLLIGGPQDFPKDIQPLFQVNYPISHQPAILTVETGKEL
jgi:4-amino-4-deoxy-L-arabinose transferase-like glycosyltransferase